jgi:GxxExxY protein
MASRVLWILAEPKGCLSLRARPLRSRMEGELIAERLTHSVIGAFFEVYNELGYGFLEESYLIALELELAGRGHRVAREVLVPISYKGEFLRPQRLDMVVDETLIVETKSTEVLAAHANRQLQNYLKASGLPVGLLLHFGPKPKFYRRIRGANSVKTGDNDHDADNAEHTD